MGYDPRYPVRFKPTFASIQGSQMLAAYVNLFFYGIAVALVSRYFMHHSKGDGLVVKAVVVSLIILATLETIFTSHQSYDTLIVKNGKPELLDVIVFSVPGKYACVYLTAFIAEVFLASRIWFVARSLGTKLRFMTIPIIILALFQLAGGLILVILEIHHGSFMKLAANTKILVEGNLIHGIGAAVCDILISITLVSILQAHRNGTKRTNSLVEKLIVYAVNRAIATSVMSILAVSLYRFASGTYYFMIPLLANTHVYLISAVTILTAREGLRQVLDESFHVSHLAMETTQTQSADKFVVPDSSPNSSTGSVDHP